MVGLTAKAAVGAGQGLFYLAMEAKSAQAEVRTIDDGLTAAAAVVVLIVVIVVDHILVDGFWRNRRHSYDSRLL